VDVQGKVAVVTGGAAGIGEVLSVGLADAGATVVVADRDGAAARRMVVGLTDRGRDAVAVETDVTDDDACRRLVARAVELGGPHILVNNAGGWSAGTDQYPVAELAVWSAAIDLNLRAPMLLAQLCRPAMEARGGGVVVCVASSAGLGTDRYGSPEYAATKAALVRFTTAMGTGADASTTGQRMVCVVPDWVGLPRAVAQHAALSPTRRAALPPLIPPASVLSAVLDLIGDDTACGTVVTLVGGEPASRLG
jgi:NAD(P)-dependent dehydrogenase (short-subunit alcohol dehydrogenase family)